MPSSSDIEAEVAVIGAGPCGLFQVFELGLQGIRARVLDALEEPGGQCMALYPEKPIYDIPALPVCSGRELTERLLEQIRPFDPQFHLGDPVQRLESIDDGARFCLTTAAGREHRVRAVVIAAGAGAFSPVQLKVPGIDAFRDSQLHYAVRDPEALRGQRLVILGGGDAALDWVLALQPLAAELTLVHRSQRFRAAEASVAEVERLAERGEIRLLRGKVSDFVADAERLSQVAVAAPGEPLQWLALDQLLVFFGMSPKLGPVGQWGLELVQNQIAVDTAHFETSLPGVYAVGDINGYSGKRKLILSGFHEAALAAYAIKARLEPGKRVPLQYTTTSPLLHERLGVAEESGQ